MVKRIIYTRLIQITNVEVFEYDNKIVENYGLKEIKWGMFYKLGNLYIDLESHKIYKPLNIKKPHLIDEVCIDTRCEQYEPSRIKSLSLKNRHK